MGYYQGEIVVAMVVSAEVNVRGEMHCGIPLRSNCDGTGADSSGDYVRRDVLWYSTNGRLWLRCWCQKL